MCKLLAALQAGPEVVTGPYIAARQEDIFSAFGNMCYEDCKWAKLKVSAPAGFACIATPSHAADCARCSTHDHPQSETCMLHSALRTAVAQERGPCLRVGRSLISGLGLHACDKIEVRYGLALPVLIHSRCTEPKLRALCGALNVHDVQAGMFVCEYLGELVR